MHAFHRVYNIFFIVFSIRSFVCVVCLLFVYVCSVLTDAVVFAIVRPFRIVFLLNLICDKRIELFLISCSCSSRVFRILNNKLASFYLIAILLMWTGSMCVYWCDLVDSTMWQLFAPNIHSKCYAFELCFCFFFLLLLSLVRSLSLYQNNRDTL